MVKKKVWLPLAIITASLISLAGVVHAQGTTQSETAIAPQVTEETYPVLSAFKGTTLSGFLDVNYFYNFRRHDDSPQQNTLSPLNFIGENENNSLTFESFTLFLDKKPTEDHPVGWQMHSYFGEKAKRITFLGEGRTNDPDRDDIFTVATANVSWLAPIGKGVTITMGKIYTWIGLELVENINNPNYQHGILYNNAIPFTHTGISAQYDPTDKIHLALYGVNGWDSFVDNNSAKSFGWYASYKPTDKAFISLAGIHGAEGWDNEKGDPIDASTQRTSSTGGLTQMFDIVASYQLTSKLKLMLNGDWGIAEDGGLDIENAVATGNTGHWWGAAGYAVYNFTDWFQGVVRYEYLDDTDGVRFFGQSVWETTVTANIKMRENLLFRPEYRFNQYADPESLGFSNDEEHIVGAGVEYLF